MNTYKLSECPMCRTYDTKTRTVHKKFHPEPHLFKWKDNQKHICSQHYLQLEDRELGEVW